MTQTPAAIREAIDAGALVVINHSGGKDSQAMMIELLAVVPREQLLVVHATLGDIEWPGALELARDQAAAAGVPFVVARAVYQDGSEKTLLNMVEKRFADRPEVPSWPSSKSRFCTSDLKRGPIAREVRRYANAHGFASVISCEGLRAQESSERAKKSTVEINGRENNSKRRWVNWLPIHDLTTEQVFATIRRAGQKPHAAYAVGAGGQPTGAGNERLSCLFCIYACKRDLANAADAHPEIFDRYVELEQRTGYTMHMSRRSLVDLVAEARLAAAA
ncbi:MAG: phosphoadenosine phosphosulfate reductase family protein [Rhodospirillaceae bacterium]